MWCQMFKTPRRLSFYSMFPSPSSTKPGCSDVQRKLQLDSAIHLRLSRVPASGFRVPSRTIHPLPAAVEGGAMLLPCLSLSKAWITLHLPAALAQGRESTAYRFHGDITQKGRGSGRSPHLELPVGASPKPPPPPAVSRSQHHTELCLFSSCFSQGAEPQLACLALS